MGSAHAAVDHFYTFFFVGNVIIDVMITMSSHLDIGVEGVMVSQPYVITLHFFMGMTHNLE